MPIKLIPQFRLLGPSLPSVTYPSMKIATSIQSSRVSPIFSRVFPFKLKYIGLSSWALRNDQVTLRRFSTRSFRPRTDSRSGSGSSRSNERERSRSSRSLVEDEAELSDWVSEFRKTSSRGPNIREEESDGDQGRSRSTFRERESFSMKRRRGSDTEEFGASNRGTRGGNDSYPKSTQGFRRNRDEFRENDSDEEVVSRRKNFGLRGKSENSMVGRRSGTDMNFGSRQTRAGDSFRNGEKNFGSRQTRAGDSFRNGEKNFGSRQTRAGDSFRNGEKNFGSRQTRAGDSFRNGEKNFGSRQIRNGDTFRKVEKNVDYRQTTVGDKFRRGEKNFDFRQARGGENLGTSEKGSRRQVLVKGEDEDDEDDEDGEDSTGSFGDLLKEENSEGEVSSDDDESDGYPLKKSSSSLLEEEVSEKPAPITRSSPGKSESYLSETRFDQCSISPFSLKAIKDAGYEKMTVVQEATLPVILKGKDVLAKAKTGTGKTVAFLLPSIEVVVNMAPMDHDQKRPPIFVLVICPTRELATQAFAEANNLLKYHHSIGVQVVIGGTRLALEQKRLQANPCQILVATPGRLRDHTENTAGFATRLKGVKVLVLDEADHLLDMGFRKDIENIIAAVPKQRQTLLFSATVPAEVQQICHIALKRDHEFINTVEEGSEETHSQVKQSHIIAPLDKHFPLLYALLKEHIADDVDYKVLVFCTTAMVTRMVANLLNELNLNVREIHSRKAQSYRTKVSDEFRKSKGLILVTSDVSARGVDYPDVTLVIQIGVPADREQYIHRLGRTGRKGKEGQGILLLAPWEEFFLLSIKDLPISKAPEPQLDPETKNKVNRALSQVEMKNKESAYQAWLGYYNSNKKIGKEKYKLVELANEFSHSMGLDNPPAIPKLVLGKMGLRNIPGLRAK